MYTWRNDEAIEDSNRSTFASGTRSSARKIQSSSPFTTGLWPIIQWRTFWQFRLIGFPKALICVSFKSKSSTLHVSSFPPHQLSRIDLQYTPNLFSKAFIISSCFSSHPSSCSLLLNLYSLETSFASDRSSSASSCSRKEISVWRCKRTRALVVPKRRRIAKLSAELRKAASCG
jgi:hypothetical protein